MVIIYSEMIWTGYSLKLQFFLFWNLHRTRNLPQILIWRAGHCSVRSRVASFHPVPAPVSGHKEGLPSLGQCWEVLHNFLHGHICGPVQHSQRYSVTAKRSFKTRRFFTTYICFLLWLLFHLSCSFFHWSWNPLTYTTLFLNKILVSFQDLLTCTAKKSQSHPEEEGFVIMCKILIMFNVLYLRHLGLSFGFLDPCSLMRLGNARWKRFPLAIMYIF